MHFKKSEKMDIDKKASKQKIETIIVVKTMSLSSEHASFI